MTSVHTGSRVKTSHASRGPHDLESVEREGQSPSTKIEPSGIVRVTPAPASASPGNTLGGAESSHCRGGGVRGTPLTVTLPPRWSSTVSPPTAATLFTNRSREPSLPPASPTSCCSLDGGLNSTRSPDCRGSRAIREIFSASTTSPTLRVDSIERDGMT
eukprot:scaffold95258_cov75-Phaeocystis_antarctica.AAC.2